MFHQLDEGMVQLITQKKKKDSMGKMRKKYL